MNTTRLDNKCHEHRLDEKGGVSAAYVKTWWRKNRQYFVSLENLIKIIFNFRNKINNSFFPRKPFLNSPFKPILWQVKAEGEINPFFPLDT